MITIGTQALKISDVADISAKSIPCTLSQNADFVKKINKSNQFLRQAIERSQTVYGVTTGFGDSVEHSVDTRHAHDLAVHLINYHRCGSGEILGQKETRAVMIARLCSLSTGFSGISYRLLEKLSLLIQRDILPRIPQEGSVGASGDLTPLSYIAATLCGKGSVTYENHIYETEVLFKQLGIAPYDIQPKESLSLMNGTSVMTGLACIAFDKAQYLNRLSEHITALVAVSLCGNKEQFSPLLFSVKPHPGQAHVAENIYNLINKLGGIESHKKLQDPYSIRCAPHIIGTLEDAFPWYESTITTELNSCNDNPVICEEEEQILHGGHFYGGHIAMVMDSMKTQIANIADLLDRQLALLVDKKYNRGLPENLVKSNKHHLNHGFKAVQIAVSAWTAEALKLTMPASVFSRSTECHNQDKVSMGTIAARDCLRILKLTEQCAGAVFMAANHAYSLRRALEGETSKIPNEVDRFISQFPLIDKDRPLDKELNTLFCSIDNQSLLYEQ